MGVQVLQPPLCQLAKRMLLVSRLKGTWFASGHGGAVGGPGNSEAVVR